MRFSCLLVPLMLACTAGAQVASFRTVPNTDPKRLQGDPYSYLVSTKPTYQNIDLYRNANGDPWQNLFIITTVTTFTKASIKAKCTFAKYIYEKSSGRRYIEIEKYDAETMTPKDPAFSVVYKAILGQKGPLHQAEGIGSLCLFSEGPTSKVRRAAPTGTFLYEKIYPFTITISPSQASAAPRK